MSRWQIIKSLVTFSSPMPNGHAVKQAGSVEVFGPTGQRNADWTMVADMPRVRDAMQKCSTAFACITLLADAVTESPLRVYQTVDGEPEERPDHRLRTLLANPNPYMSEAEFMSLTVMTMGVFNYAVTEKVRSAAGLPVQLWPLRPDWLVRERTGAETYRWVYKIPGIDPYEIKEQDIIFTPYYHDPMRQRLGWGPLSVIAREIGVDVSLTDLLKVFIDAGGIPPWAIELPPDANMDQAKVDAFRAKWAQFYGGTRAYGQAAVLHGGMKIIKIGDSIGDMAWPDLRGLTEQKIAQAFRVPLDLIQGRETMSSGSLTTTEMTGAMAFLQNHGAQPLRMRIDGAFSRSLLSDFGADPSYSLEFDTSGILSLQEDEDAKHTRWRANFDAGLVTMNEARQAIGLPDLGPTGEVIKLSFTTVLQPLNGSEDSNGTPRASQAITARSGGIPAITEVSVFADGNDGDERFPLGHTSGADMYSMPYSGKRRIRDDGTEWIWSMRHQRILVYRNTKHLSPADLEVRASILATTRRQRDKLAEIGARQLRKFFKQQGERIIDDMPKATGVVIWHKDQPWIKSFAVDGVHSKAIQWDDEDRLLRALMDKFYGSVGSSAFGTVAAQLDVDLDWTLANPNVARVMDQLGGRIVDISEQTRQDVIRVITDGQNEGLSLSQISDNIRGMFEETYKSRAETIARTETQVSYNLASQVGYQESGVVENVEMVDNPDHTDDYGASDGLTCAQRDGLVVNIGQMDAHVDAEHPNGSLAFIPILSTPLGE
jgi:HK97 family phage portal protein